MTHSLLQRELETRLKAQMDYYYPSVDIRWENVDLDRNNEAILVAPVMKFGRGFVSSVGRKSTRSVGLFQVDVLAPKDTGTALRNEIAEFIGNFFSAKSYSLPGDNGRATMDEAEYQNMGLVNGKDRLVVSITYEIDKTRLN